MKDKISCCIECGSHNIEYVTKPEIVKVVDDEIMVDASYWLCYDCKSEFKNMFDGNSYLLNAYNIYREKHNMLMPEEIKAIREQYGLTQEELASLLGWDKKSIARYERGSLQDSSHDRMLKLLKEPVAFLRLINDINMKLLNNMNIVKSASKCRELIKTKYSHNDCYKDILETV
jgi:putative zinc finger/helix-turn-helix YgiT family protein